MTAATALVRESADVMAALRAVRGCQQCTRSAIEIRRARADYFRVAHKAAADKTEDPKWPRLIRRTREDLARIVDYGVTHLDEPHTAPEPEPPKPVRLRVVKDDPRVKCPACGRRVKEKAPGRIGGHKTPTGQSCPRRLLALSVEAPPVVLPPPHAARFRHKTGKCHACDRPVSGERHFCGQCLRKRGRL